MASEQTACSECGGAGGFDREFGYELCRCVGRKPETAARAEFAAWRDATNETTPFHLWRDAVELETLRRCPGCHETLRAQRARILRAYQAGEPVWMAVDEMVLRANAARVVDQAERSPAVISTMAMLRMIGGGRP
jgi:hypothetical protein